MIRLPLFAMCAFCFLTASAQSWTPFAPVPNGFLSDHSFGFALGGEGFLVAGQTPDGFSDNVFRYNPASDSWSTMQDFPGEARGYTIGDTWNGEAWMGFGLGNDGALNDLWKFNPISETWTEMASCPCEPRYHPAFVAMDGHIYMGLGSGLSGDLDDWWDYDMATNSWSQKPSLPASPRHHPYQFGIDGIVYTGFGHSGSNIFNTWYAYDPSSESWTEVAELPAEGRVAGTQFSHNGLGYVLSGDGEDHSSMEDGEFWAYNPATDAWSEWPSHPGWSRWAPASFIIDDVVYFMQGTTADPASDLYVASNYKFNLVPETENDVALTGFLGAYDGCGDANDPIVAEIQNLGASGQFTLTLSMVSDGDVLLSQPWSGTLASYETTGVVLGNYDTSSLNNFELLIEEDDEDTSNNTFTVQPTELPEAYLTCVVSLTTDEWGDETGWQIVDNDGNQVAGAPAGTYNSNESYEIDVDLPAEGCYELILTDEYGDGMVGNWNSESGSFTLTTFEIPGNPFTDYNIFEYDGESEFSELRLSFRAVDAEASSLEAQLEALNLEAHPNPASQTLNLTGIEGAGTLEVWTALGQRMFTAQVRGNTTLDVSNWPSGLYVIRFRDGRSRRELRVVKQ